MTADQAIGELERDLRDMKHFDFDGLVPEINGIVFRAEEFMRTRQAGGLEAAAYGSLTTIKNHYSKGIPFSDPYQPLIDIQDLLPPLRRALFGVFERENHAYLDVLQQTAEQIKAKYAQFKTNRALMNEKLTQLRRK